jgi:hypothetical protein
MKFEDLEDDLNSSDSERPESPKEDRDFLQQM